MAEKNTVNDDYPWAFNFAEIFPHIFAKNLGLGEMTGGGSAQNKNVSGSS
jgi:hypothetical protein